MKNLPPGRLEAESTFSYTYNWLRNSMLTDLSEDAVIIANRVCRTLNFKNRTI